MPKRVFLAEDNPTICRSLAETIVDPVPARIIGWVTTQQDACNELSLLKNGWDLALVDLLFCQAQDAVSGEDITCKNSGTSSLRLPYRNRRRK
jgi:hypothetical protein